MGDVVSGCKECFSVLQDNVVTLADRAVAYINVDEAVSG